MFVSNGVAQRWRRRSGFYPDALTGKFFKDFAGAS